MAGVDLALAVGEGQSGGKEIMNEGEKSRLMEIALFLSRFLFFPSRDRGICFLHHEFP